MVFDSALFAVLTRPLRAAIAAARTSGARTAPEFGPPFPKPAWEATVRESAASAGG